MSSCYSVSCHFTRITPCFHFYNCITKNLPSFNKIISGSDKSFDENDLINTNDDNKVSNDVVASSFYFENEPNTTKKSPQNTQSPKGTVVSTNVTNQSSKSTIQQTSTSSTTKQSSISTVQESTAIPAKQISTTQDADKQKSESNNLIIIIIAVVFILFMFSSSFYFSRL